MLGTKAKEDLIVDGVTWIPVRDAANLIESTPATIYNQVDKKVIEGKLVGKSVLLVSKEDTIKYGGSKKTYFKRFIKKGSN